MNMLIAGGRSYSGWTLNVCCSADAAWLNSESGGLFLPSVAASVSRTGGGSGFLNERPLGGEEKDPPQVKITPGVHVSHTGHAAHSSSHIPGSFLC